MYFCPNSYFSTWKDSELSGGMPVTSAIFAAICLTKGFSWQPPWHHALDDVRPSDSTRPVSPN